MVYYVERGLAGVLQCVRANILVGMVRKYYELKHSHEMKPAQLDVSEMLVHYRWNGMSVEDACTEWILPLMLQKRIKGSICNGKLLLAGAKQDPFYLAKTS